MTTVSPAVVVADDVDGVPAPGARGVGAVEAPGPVPDLLVHRPERKLEADVEAAEEPGAGPDEIVVAAADPGEGPDQVAADAGPAPER